MSMKTVDTLRGNVLDLTEYEFNSIQDIVNAVLKVCEKYHTFAPSKLPDILKLSKEQRDMFPKGIWLMRSPYNVMEMITHGVDNNSPLGDNANDNILT